MAAGAVLQGVAGVLWNAFGSLAKVAASAFNIVFQEGWNMAKGLVSSTIKATLSYHEQAYSFARQAGMGLARANTYTTVLTARARDLGYQFGIAAEQANKIEESLAKATGRAMVFTQQQAKGIIAMNRLVGEDNSQQFMEQMTRSMGGSYQAVEKAVARVYATAQTQGLHAANLSAKVASNLSLANKLSFRNGVEGITKMTALSERLGFNLQAIEGATANFLELDKAIEHSAQLQMLGGVAGIYGSNPLTMAYEANYDPEAFAKRTMDMMRGLATFDTKTGMASVNGMNMDIARGIAQAMNISLDQVVGTAKKQAEMRFKEDQLGSLLKRPDLSEAQREYILNQSYVENGEIKINRGDEALTVAQFLKDANDKEWKELAETRKYMSKQDEHGLLVEQATSLRSINDKVTGLWTTITGTFAEPLSKKLPSIQAAIDKYAPKLINLAKGALDWIVSVDWRSWIDRGKELLGKVTKFLDNSNRMLTILGGILAAVTVIKGAQWVRGLFRGRGGSGGAPIGGGITPSASNGAIFNPKTATYAANARATNQALKSYRGGSITQQWRDLRYAQKMAYNSPELQGLNKGKRLWRSWTQPIVTSNNGTYAQYGGGFGTNAAKFGAQSTDNLRRAANAANLGSKVGTGLKVAAGGAATLGGVLAAWGLDSYRQNNLEKNPNELGSNYDAGINAASAALTGAGIGATIGSFIPLIGTAIGAAIGGIGGGLYGWFNAKKQGQDARNAAVQGRPEDYGFATGGIVGGTSYTGDKLTARVNSGEMVLNAEQQANLFKHINTPVAKMMGDGVTSVLTNRNDVQAKPVGNKEYIYTPKTVQTSTVNGNTITVKDFNLNVKGSIRLEGGNSSRDIDMNALLNDLTFVNALKEAIKQSINNDINGGRLMNDVAQMRGLPAQTTLWGR